MLRAKRKNRTTIDYRAKAISRDDGIEGGRGQVFSKGLKTKRDNSSLRQRMRVLASLHLGKVPNHAYHTNKQDGRVTRGHFTLS